MRYTKRYKSLPYNPELKARARELRKAGMLHEVLLWQQLKGKQLLGLNFNRQKIIGNYIVDFYCAEKGVVIEADGTSHDWCEEYDTRRDAFFIGLGLEVIHIDVRDILTNIEAVLVYLREHEALTARPPRSPEAAAAPREGNDEGDESPAPTHLQTPSKP